jgi:hypothetical protein
LAQIAGLVRAAAGIVRTVEKVGEEDWRVIERSRRRHKTEGSRSEIGHFECRDFRRNTR